MESIFHEKQEGYLCAQHCLNALLQGPYYNAVDLANLAHQMDEEERIRMAESGVDSEDYRHFLQQPSGNVDDSGYFSVQVISSALKVWGLELIPYNSTESIALMTQKDPLQGKAYICNYKGHWFTIRKIGNQWFNLNSMLTGPQLISDTYLTMFLAQLIQEGYSIFIVIGSFPLCSADDVLAKRPVSATTRSDPAFVAAASTSRVSRKRAEAESSSQQQQQQQPPSRCQEERIIPIKIKDDSEDEDEDSQLQKALRLSLQDFNEEEKKDFNVKDIQAETEAGDDEDEEDELRRALRLSLECVTTPPTPEQEELFWSRLTFLNSRTPSGESQANQLNT